MFKVFSKHMVLVAICMIAAFSIGAHEVNKGHHKETKYLQAVINLTSPNLVYYSNIASTILSGLAGFYAPRPAGGYVITGALLYPGNTVAIGQPSYNVDQYGYPLTAANSIGLAYAFEKNLVDFDLSGPLPPAGTKISMSEQHFYFNKPCKCQPNNIFSLGFSVFGGAVIPGQSIQTYEMGIAGGTGCNVVDNSFIARSYISSSGDSVLVTFEFDEEIEYAV